MVSCVGGGGGGVVVLNVLISCYRVCCFGLVFGFFFSLFFLSLANRHVVPLPSGGGHGWVLDAM